MHCICWYLSCLFVSTCCTHDESAWCRLFLHIFLDLNNKKKKKILFCLGIFLDNLTKQILQIHKLLVVPLELRQHYQLSFFYLFKSRIHIESFMLFLILIGSEHWCIAWSWNLDKKFQLHQSITDHYWEYWERSGILKIPRLILLYSYFPTFIVPHTHQGLSYIRWVGKTLSKSQFLHQNIFDKLRNCMSVIYVSYSDHFNT